MIAVHNKTIEALLRGYILFAVNGHRFRTYNAANAACDAITGDVIFDGFHIFKGWRRFFSRTDCAYLQVVVVRTVGANL